MFVGVAKITNLKKLDPKVAVFSMRTENTPQVGYQRKIEENRARKFGKFVTEGNISPVSLILSIRKENMNAVNIFEHSGREGDMGLVESDNVTVSINPEKCTVWIVDGQHRWRGLQDVDDRKLEGFQMPFTLICGMDDYKEAEQFVIINKTQKAVRTDLAERFIAEALRMRGETSVSSDPNVAIFRKAVWVSRAIQILDTLTDPGKKGVWVDKVQMPNELKAKTMTVTQSAFTNSLEVLINKLGPFANEDLYKLCDVVEHVEAFWNAIRTNCPTPFQPRSDTHEPNNYAIQGTIGVSSLHRLLAMIWKDLTGAISDKDFEALLAVDGIQDVGKWDRTVDNVETGAKGGAWTMMGTNQKAFRVIADKIYSEIKETKVYKDLVAKKRMQ